MKLHLCCGKRNFGADWFHIDRANYPHIHSHDITKLPYSDNSADLIYCSHGLEYFDRDEVVPVLIEWRRVLKKGGVLRIAVPNFTKISLFYFEFGMPLNVFLGLLYGRMEVDGDVIYHKTVYDYPSLKKLLSDCGFRGVRFWDWRKVDHGGFDDHSQAYLPHMDKDNGVLMSLNMEAKK